MVLSRQGTDKGLSDPDRPTTGSPLVLHHLRLTVTLWAREGADVG